MATPLPSQPRAINLQNLKSHLLGTISSDLESTPLGDDRKGAIILMIQKAFTELKYNFPTPLKDQVTREILDELLGFGPLQPLLDDPDISEVMVNGHEKVYIERKGKIIRTDITFPNDDAVLRMIDKIIMPLGRRIDADSPTVDARLPDGSRVNAVIPPVAIDGPTITIRKFQKDKLTMEQYINLGTVTENMAEFMRICVLSRLNIIISGGTGSGKTTLLNILSSFISPTERIVTIEDAAELKLQQDHVVRMETKTPNSDGKGAVTIRDLVRNSLRMRPDRIVVGEVRGGEALDMLQAMNTGHDGSLTTLHANSPRDALSRLETLVLMSGMDLPLRVIREQASAAVDLIIQQSRLKDGSRKITSITEICGMEGDTVVMTDIFKFQQSGVGENGMVIGELKPTGIRPLFYPRIEAAGFRLGPEVFGANIGVMLAHQERRSR